MARPDEAATVGQSASAWETCAPGWSSLGRTMHRHAGPMMIRTTPVHVPPPHHGSCRGELEGRPAICARCLDHRRSGCECTFSSARSIEILQNGIEETLLQASIKANCRACSPARVASSTDRRAGLLPAICNLNSSLPCTCVGVALGGSSLLQKGGCVMLTARSTPVPPSAASPNRDPQSRPSRVDQSMRT
jgi:hypothetical protein